MKEIVDRLFLMQDVKYRKFNSKLIPGVETNKIIGVRTPDLKKYAKELVKENKYINFIDELPHEYFEENQLHAFIISEIKDYDLCIEYINLFLRYIDNWATSDQLSPKIFDKNKDKLFKHIQIWINDSKTYTIRFGILMLMRYYLDDLFNKKYLDMVCNVRSFEYYVNMARAWFFATALAKQYDDTIKIFESNKLDVWTHNKAIQKAIESYRVSDEHKCYLRLLKRKSIKN